MAQPPARPVPQVVMSATLDAAAFTRYFNGAQAAYIQVGGWGVIANICRAWGIAGGLGGLHPGGWAGCGEGVRCASLVLQGSEAFFLVNM